MIEKIEQAVGDEIDDFDEEMAAPHCRIDDFKVQQPFDQVLMVIVRLQSRPLAVIHFVVSDVGRWKRPRLLQLVVERLPHLAELGAQLLKLFGQDRTDRIGHNVFDHRIGSVIRARRLAFGLVVGEVDLAFGNDDSAGQLPLPCRFGLAQRDIFLALLVGLGRQVLRRQLEFEFQQSLIDRTQMPDIERLVVDENKRQGSLVLVSRQPVDGQGQIPVRDLVLHKKSGDVLVSLVRLSGRRVEQASIVGRHIENRIPFVHRLKQPGQAIAEGGVLCRVSPLQVIGHFAFCDAGLIGDLSLEFFQAGIEIGRFSGGKQITTFGIQQKQQPIQQSKRGLEDD